MKKILLTAVSVISLSVASLAQAEQNDEAAAALQLGMEALANSQFQQAAKLFEAAYKNGKADGAFFLGQMAEYGSGAQQNMSTAVALYRAAAEGKSALALQRLGLLHFQGEGGLLQDFDQAHEMLCEAADLGLAQAMVNCAQLYQTGRGLQQSTEKAISYYDKGIDLKFSPAFVEKARMYSDGKAVEKDEQKAHELLKSAAGLGNVAGLFHMALASETGEFVEQDLIKAHMYYNLASARGHTPSKEAMKRLSETLSPADTKAAQKAAIAWTKEKSTAALVEETAEDAASN